MSGLRFSTEKIPALTTYIYQGLTSFINDEVCIKNNKILLFVYTLCKVEDMILFVVFPIYTTFSVQDRTEGEKSYGIAPGACCLKNYSLKNSLDIDLNDQEKYNTLKLKSEQNCQYKNDHIECNAFALYHVLNVENKKVTEKFSNYFFVFPVSANFTYSPLPTPVHFCYCGAQQPSSLTCTMFYNSLVLEKRGDILVEHNFKNFLSDALRTCYRDLETLVSCSRLGKIEEHRLLHVSVIF